MGFIELRLSLEQGLNYDCLVTRLGSTFHILRPDVDIYDDTFVLCNNFIWRIHIIGATPKVTQVCAHVNSGVNSLTLLVLGLIYLSN